MPRRKAKRAGLTSAVLAIALVATACGGNASVDDSATSVPDTSGAAAPPSAAALLEASADSCAAYLEFLGAQDGVALNAALADLFASVDEAELNAAILTVRDGTGPIGEVRAASDLLSAALVPACEDAYNSEVTPTATDQEAAQALTQALISGDRDAAGAVAWANVIAQFEPWEPVPDAVTPLEFEIDADLLTFEIDQGIEIDCLLGQGQIILCEFE